jgi:hypothetical protein
VEFTEYIRDAKSAREIGIHIDRDAADVGYPELSGEITYYSSYELVIKTTLIIIKSIPHMCFASNFSLKTK